MRTVQYFRRMINCTVGGNKMINIIYEWNKNKCTFKMNAMRTNIAGERVC